MARSLARSITDSAARAQVVATISSAQRGSRRVGAGIRLGVGLLRGELRLGVSLALLLLGEAAGILLGHGLRAASSASASRSR
jgi:hypothetical protein